VIVVTKNIVGILSAVVLIGACSSAPKSNEVSAAYIPIAQYNNYTCDQLISEAESVRRSVPALESAVDKHRENQTGVEVVTWILFFPAALALDKGEATSSQLAKARGELQAIQTALLAKHCNSQLTASATTVPSTSAGLGVAPAIPKETTNVASPGERLRELDKLRKDGLITEAEYSVKKQKLLEAL
jgi:hypothetical protein